MLNVRKSIIQRGDTMRVDITSSGEFKDTISWLNKVSNKQPTSTLKRIGNDGVKALRSATPIGETGATASGWNYKISRTSKGFEISWYNNAHPEVSANVAKLIQFGHGTGTGGYVPPRDYINPALRNIFNGAGDKLAKEVFK